MRAFSAIPHIDQGLPALVVPTPQHRPARQEDCEPKIVKSASSSGVPTQQQRVSPPAGPRQPQFRLHTPPGRSFSARGAEQISPSRHSPAPASRMEAACPAEEVNTPLRVKTLPYGSVPPSLLQMDDDDEIVAMVHGTPICRKALRTLQELGMPLPTPPQSEPLPQEGTPLLSTPPMRRCCTTPIPEIIPFTPPPRVLSSIPGDIPGSAPAQGRKKKKSKSPALPQLPAPATPLVKSAPQPRAIGLGEAIAAFQHRDNIFDIAAAEPFAIAGICFHRYEMYLQGMFSDLQGNFTHVDGRGTLLHNANRRKGFGNLRGLSGLTQRLWNYILEHKGNPGAIARWGWQNGLRTWSEDTYPFRVYSAAERSASLPEALNYFYYFRGLSKAAPGGAISPSDKARMSLMDCAEVMSEGIERQPALWANWTTWVMHRAFLIELFSQGGFI